MAKKIHTKDTVDEHLEEDKTAEVHKKESGTEKRTAGEWIRHHQRVIIFVVVAVVMCSGIGIYAYVYTHKDEGPKTTYVKQTKKKVAKAGESKTLPRRIDGVVVAREDANKLPACVMIENAAFGGVRPQSGLSKASVVYEVIVEGGITRYMAVFAGDVPSVIGPIRSARDTYLEFVREYNCPYVHAGGSFTAIRAIQEKGIRNVDALIDSKYFYRDQGKASPHNLFGRADRFIEATNGHDWNDKDPEYDSWKFVDQTSITVEADSANNSAAQSVSVDFGGSYSVEYKYNTEKGVYERFLAGVLQTDASNNNESISARNVIIQHVGAGISIEGKGRVNWPVTGSGDVDIYRNGVHTKGRWTKDTATSRTKYTLPDGTELPLARGNSWVDIVPEGIGFTDN